MPENYTEAYYKAMNALAWVSGYCDPDLRESLDHLSLLHLRDKINKMAQEAREAVK